VKLAESTKDDFLTTQGKSVKKLIISYFNKLKLNTTIGCSPATYSPNDPVESKNSLYNLYMESILPSMIYNSSRTCCIPFFLTNPFALRDTLYEGRVVKNDIYSIMPFGDSYYFFPNVTGAVLVAFLKKTEFGPKYYHSFISIDPSQTYDMICSGYDSTVIAQILQQIYKTITWTPQLYPTNYDSTDAIQQYISITWPCNS